MFDGVIYICSLPWEIADVRELHVKLRGGARMGEVIAALKERVPALEGPAFREGKNRLQHLYKFNVNGNFYCDGQDFQLQKEEGRN
jgi:hypothetical protein